MLSASQEAAVATTVTDLGNSLLNAYATVSLTFSSWGADGSKAAVEKNLQADGERIERLKGDLLDSLRAGDLSWDKWTTIATTTHEDIQYQAGLTGEWSLTSVLKNAAADTANDVAQGAAKVADEVKAAGGGFGIGLALGLLAVGYVWWKA